MKILSKLKGYNCREKTPIFNTHGLEYYQYGRRYRQWDFAGRLQIIWWKKQ